MPQVDVSYGEGLDERYAAWGAQIEAEAAQALVGLGLTEAELSVLLCSDAEIRPLNAQWRDKDEATDVLSFPQHDEDEQGGQADVLGDVVISVDTTIRQSQEFGHSELAELRVLLVHGLCHLLGYDHLDAEEAVEMKALEARVLGLLGAQGGVSGLVERGTGD